MNIANHFGVGIHFLSVYLQRSGAAEEFATPFPIVEVAQKKTLQHSGDRKSQEGNGRS